MPDVLWLSQQADKARLECKDPRSCLAGHGAHKLRMHQAHQIGAADFTGARVCFRMVWYRADLLRCMQLLTF